MSPPDRAASPSSRDPAGRARERAILHVDMDAFFASVEQLDNPELRGKPVLVGHDGARGVVSAASYEARTFGCHSALPTAIARRRCPQAIIVPVRGGRYREVSLQVFAIFESITPLVEPLSIDEAFLDVSGSRRLFGGDEVAIARHIKQRILAETGVTGSVGVAPNKFLAKLASDWDKPDGLTVVRADELPGRLAPLAIGEMWGVGPATEARLRAAGIATFGDLQGMSLERAGQLLGERGAERYWRLARGEDDRPVTPDHEAKSLGAEQTFGVDVAERGHVRQVLLGQCERVAQRLRRHALQGRTVTVKIRYGDFETITRSATLPEPTERTDLLWQATAELWDRWAARSFRPVRLIGMSISQLDRPRPRQTELFGTADDTRSRAVDAATDAIQARFGHGAVHRGIPHGEGPAERVPHRE